jgi:hypothetical protein
MVYIFASVKTKYSAKYFWKKYVSHDASYTYDVNYFDVDYILSSSLDCRCELACSSMARQFSATLPLWV